MEMILVPMKIPRMLTPQVKPPSLALANDLVAMEIILVPVKTPRTLTFYEESSLSASTTVSGATVMMVGAKTPRSLFGGALYMGQRLRKWQGARVLRGYQYTR